MVHDIDSTNTDRVGLIDRQTDRQTEAFLHHEEGYICKTKISDKNNKCFFVQTAKTDKRDEKLKTEMTTRITIHGTRWPIIDTWHWMLNSDNKEKVSAFKC